MKVKEKNKKHICSCSHLKSGSCHISFHIKFSFDCSGGVSICCLIISLLNEGHSGSCMPASKEREMQSNSFDDIFVGSRSRPPSYLYLRRFGFWGFFLVQ